jgi:alpha-mannosidase
LFTENGDWQENKVHLLARNIESSPWSNPRDRALRSLADSILTTDSDDVWVAAIKPASRGEGIIVRLNAPVLPKSPVLVAARQFKVTGAFLCDARERDLNPLEVQDGKVKVTMPGTVATIRLLPG